MGFVLPNQRSCGSASFFFKLIQIFHFVAGPDQTTPSFRHVGKSGNIFTGITAVPVTLFFRIVIVILIGVIILDILDREILWKSVELESIPIRNPDPTK
jgi:hypothetical protein